MPYLDYLKSADWRKKKQAVLEKAIKRGKGRVHCARCGRPLGYQEMEFHHLSYHKILHETPISEIVLVHKQCHRKLEEEKRKKALMIDGGRDDWQQ